jgi:hypothetical protein
MPCSKSNLLSTFYGATTIFNAHQDTSIGGILEETITINNYDQQVITNIGPVEQYFYEEFQKDALFTPTVTDYNVSGSGTTGLVIGWANWTSATTSPEGEEFDFQFQFVCENGRWMLLNIRCYDPGDPQNKA